MARARDQRKAKSKPVPKARGKAKALKAAAKPPIKARPGQMSRGRLAALEPWAELRRQINQLFDGFDRDCRRFPFALSAAKPLWRENGWAAPAMDVIETDGGYEVTAELPGVNESDIEVTLADGQLTISGEKEESEEDKKKDYYFSERRYGSFARSFPVPNGVDMEQAKASFKDGVLTVTLPKSAEARASEKRIPVRHGG